MSTQPKVAAVVAMDQSRVIGLRGALPWHIPEDLAHFRKLTAGHVVVMGRKTWDSLPEKFKPLPGRTNVVVSRRSTELDLPQGVLRASSPEEGLRIARQAAEAHSQTVWVIGGAELYKALLPACDEVHLTIVRGTHEGDAWLPEFESGFTPVSEQAGEQCSFHVFAKR
jgi:dihydrofolate reductase